LSLTQDRVFRFQVFSVFCFPVGYFYFFLPIFSFHAPSVSCTASFMHYKFLSCNPIEQLLEILTVYQSSILHDDMKESCMKERVIFFTDVTMLISAVLSDP
jgi:hypothetical protein